MEFVANKGRPPHLPLSGAECSRCPAAGRLPRLPPYLGSRSSAGLSTAAATAEAAAAGAAVLGSPWRSGAPFRSEAQRFPGRVERDQTEGLRGKQRGLSRKTPPLASLPPSGLGPALLPPPPRNAGAVWGSHPPSSFGPVLLEAGLTPTGPGLSFCSPISNLLTGIHTLVAQLPSKGPQHNVICVRNCVSHIEREGSAEWPTATGYDGHVGWFDPV